jgi:hypothetical protein
MKNVASTLPTIRLSTAYPLERPRDANIVTTFGFLEAKASPQRSRNRSVIACREQWIRVGLERAEKLCTQSCRSRSKTETGLFCHGPALKQKAQMNKQTVALIALFAGWILTADIVNATIYEDIAGQWYRLRLRAEYADREISRWQTGQCVQDHEVRLHQRQCTY